MKVHFKHRRRVLSGYLVEDLDYGFNKIQLEDGSFIYVHDRDFVDLQEYKSERWANAIIVSIAGVAYIVFCGAWMAGIAHWLK